MSIQCVITGCALISGMRWVAGDLFDAGSVYIFNGNMERETVDPKWLSLPATYSKALEPDDWFERRGMFVIEKSKANLNQKALDYIKRRVIA
jgi:hypothetical protein